jgi:hypothetical protein
MSEQLRGAASILAADLNYARNLAVTNGSSYRVAFFTDNNKYVLSHTGANSALDKLPSSPFRPSSDADDEQTCDFDRLPHMGATVHLHAVHQTGAWEPVSDVEFGPLGGTTRPQATVVWLRCGSDSNRRFLPLTIDPTTGLVTVGETLSQAPVAAVGG